MNIKIQVGFCSTIQVGFCCYTAYYKNVVENNMNIKTQFRLGFVVLLHLNNAHALSQCVLSVFGRIFSLGRGHCESQILSVFTKDRQNLTVEVTTTKTENPTTDSLVGFSVVVVVILVVRFHCCCYTYIYYSVYLISKCL